MSNLPPGVSVNDIPGNRPEDIAYEEKWNRLFELWTKNPNLKDFLDDLYDSDGEEAFELCVDIAMEFAYTEGWKDREYELKLTRPKRGMSAAEWIAAGMPEDDEDDLD